MTNINITNFRKSIYELVEQAIKFNEPINISSAVRRIFSIGF